MMMCRSQFVLLVCFAFRGQCNEKEHKLLWINLMYIEHSSIGYVCEDTWCLSNFINFVDALSRLIASLFGKKLHRVQF